MTSGAVCAICLPEEAAGDSCCTAALPSCSPRWPGASSSTTSASPESSRCSWSRSRAVTWHSKKMSLRHREVLLAGVAGGLGSALASLLLAEGARVIVSYRRNPPQANDAAIVLQGDLANSSDRARLLDAA